MIRLAALLNKPERPNLSGDFAIKGKILNTWEVDSSEILASQEVHDIAVEWEDGSRFQTDLKAAYVLWAKFAFLPMLTQTASHSHTDLCVVLRHFPRLGLITVMFFVAMPPCTVELMR